VDRQSGVEPNAQVEVGIRFEPVAGTTVNYDFYSQANAITANPSTVCNPPYPTGPLAVPGSYAGCLGNLLCATKSVPDQNTCGTKTIWYSFEVATSGRIRINYDRPNGTTTWSAQDMQLYYQVVPGDSTAAGLLQIPLTGVWRNNNPGFNPGTNYFYGEACMPAG
jgi:hypothetical protein